MLPARHRLRDSRQFRAAVRGARSGLPLIVVHATLTDPAGVRPARVGFVVSKAVGNAVVRTRTKRVLRAAVREHLIEVPAGVDVVVRANPDAAAASWDEISAQVGTALRRSVGKAVRA